ANFLMNKESQESMGKRAAAMQKELLDALPEEIKQGIDKDTAFLGTLLDDKWDALKDPKVRDKFAKKIPQTHEFFGKILEEHQQKPSANQLREMLDQYQLQRSIQASPLANPYQARSVALEEGLSTLFSDLFELQSKLTTLAPEKGAPLDEKIHTLRQEMHTLSRALRESVEEPPAPTCERETFHTWVDALEKKCFSLQELEKHAAGLISEARAEIDSHVLSASDSELSAFGNKHKNIIKQARLAKALDLKGIEVPVPQGVSTEEVLIHLKTVAPQIFTAWEDLQKQYQGEPSFLQTEEAQQALKIIDHAIEEAFQTFPLSEEMKQWLEKIDQRGSYLMVRSTGAEDSRKAANAGGNQSPAYVPAREKELREALGRVVRSYFGIRSLQNRLNAGINPFEEELSLAVTAQELIGEPIGGSKVPKDIPISLVAFTNEPLYIGDEKFRVFRLSATYGYGEGVVGNQGIESDTVIVLHSASQPDRLYILYDNHEKLERLAPVRDPHTQDVKLEKVANPECLVKTPALSGELIARLFQWGIIAESYFEDDATDMEIVIKRDTIYPVQARPVNRKGLLPTYLDQKKITESGQELILDTVQSEVLVPGKASVVSLPNREAILIADTLEQAERQFQKDKHKLVIVHKSEPANSHPVVNFSSLGIPCLYVSSKEALESLMTKEGPLAVCMQAGEIHLWDQTKGEIAEYTSEGFVVHPAKVAVSLPISQSLPTDAGVSNQIPQEVEDLIRRIRTANTQEVAFAGLKELRQHAWIKSFLKNAQTLQGFDREVKPIAKAAKTLEEAVERAFSELETTLSNPHSGRLETLLRVKVLETLLFTSPQPGTALGQYSVVGIQGNFAAAQALVDYQKKLSHTAHFADILLAGSESPIDEVTKRWQDFLLSLEWLAEEKIISSLQIVRFKEIVHLMQKAKIFPIYLTFFFNVNAYSLQKTLKDFLDCLSTRDEKMLLEILTQKKAIQREIAHFSEFSHPKTFEKAFASLQKIHEYLFVAIGQPPRKPPPGFLEGIRNYFYPVVEEKTIDAFLSRFSPAIDPERGLFWSPFIWQLSSIPARFTILEMLNDYTHAYDLAIKAMKASPHFSNAQKVKHFQRMLGSYYRLLREVCSKISDEQSVFSCRHALDSIEKRLKELHNTQSDQLQPSKDFCVATAVFAEEVGRYYFAPQTLEDVFTFIHQTLLARNARLANALISAKDLFRAVPQKLKEVLVSLDRDRTRPSDHIKILFDRKKVDISPEKIELQYNIPLRNHNSFFTIIYYQETEEIELVAQLFWIEDFGVDRGRWESVVKSIEICSESGILPLAKPIYPNNRQEMRITWNSRDAKIDTIFDFYHELLQSTFFHKPGAVFYEPAASNYIHSLIQKKFSSYSASELLPFISKKNLIMSKKFWELFFQASEKEKQYHLIEEAMQMILQIKDQRKKAEVFSFLIDMDRGCPASASLANLFEGSFYPEAIETAKALMMKEEYQAGIELFGILIDHEQAYQEAIKWASKLTKKLLQKGPIIYGIRLFMKLFEKGQGHQEALEASKQMTRTDNQYYKEAFFKKLEEFQKTLE
ncbi:MAG: hypothetical protein KR126chlam3_00357, partial [Chlamydiae bacterium]|nr:hypothetical protein [Chlamydiota bacterium]